MRWSYKLKCRELEAKKAGKERRAEDEEDIGNYCGSWIVDAV